MSLHGTGVFYGADRARDDLLEPTRPGEHVWIVLATHVLDAETIRRVNAGRQEIHLDAENLAGVYVGCYVCEQPWSDRISYRRCPGEPA